MSAMMPLTPLMLMMPEDDAAAERYADDILRC
jgi:hypothetical protein